MAGDLQAVASSKCDFCEERRAFLYCRPDSARLCLSCDHHVHAANPLSLKHTRAPLCECCGERSATLQCEEEARFFCAACEQSGHNGEGHTVVKASTFSGCIAPSQLASAWKCHAPNLFLDAFLLSRGAALDKLCWNPDGSLGSILASPWTTSFDSFLLSDANSGFTDMSFSSDRLVGGGHCVGNKAFLEQLEQLQRRQAEADITLTGLIQDPFQSCLAPSLEQCNVPFINIEAQTYADAQTQQEVPVQQLSNSRRQHTRPFNSNSSWTGGTERKVLGTRVTTAKNTSKQLNEVHRHPLVANTKEGSWMVPPPSSLIVNKEKEDFCKSEEQLFSLPQSCSRTFDASWPCASQSASITEREGLRDCPSLSPKEATESLSFNEEAPIPCLKLSSPEVQNQPELCISYSLLNRDSSVMDCEVAPIKCDIAVSAQARGSAMLRYKEKRKTRNFEKFVRYESRKARAETRLRVRGRFVKAKGFNSLVADEIG